MIPLLHDPLPLTLTMLLLLVVARLVGELFERLGQPAMIGEVLAGFILGPSLLGYIQINEQLNVLSELGVFLLVIHAGLEIRPEEMRRAIGGRNIWIVLLGFFVPMAGGFSVGQFFGLDMIISLFIGLCMSITALPVSVRILMDIGRLKTPIGQKIISAAMANDLIAFLILGVIIGMNGEASGLNDFIFAILWTFLKIGSFVIVIIFSFRFFQYLDKKFYAMHRKVEGLVELLKGKESLFALVIMFVLVFASISELLGLHFVIGAFFGAVLLNRENLGPKNFAKIQENTSTITMGFLAPIFFAYMGIQFNVLSLNNWPLIITVLISVFAFKIVGVYWGARLARMRPLESLTLGIGMNTRGIMELLIANIALRYGFIDVGMYSILVLMGITTTLVSPYFLKRAFLLLDIRRPLLKAPDTD